MMLLKGLSNAMKEMGDREHGEVEVVVTEGGHSTTVTKNIKKGH